MRDTRRRRRRILRQIEGRPKIVRHLPPFVVHRCAQRYFQFVILVPQRAGAAVPVRIVDTSSKPVHSRLATGVLEPPFMIQRNERRAVRPGLLSEQFSRSSTAAVHPRLHFIANSVRNVMAKRPVELCIELGLCKNRLEQPRECAPILRLDLRMPQQSVQRRNSRSPKKRRAGGGPGVALAKDRVGVVSHEQKTGIFHTAIKIVVVIEACVEARFAVVEQRHQREVREPLLDIDHLADAIERQFLLRVEHTQHLDQVRPVVLGGVGRLQPGVAVAVRLPAAILKSAWGDIAPRAVQVTAVVSREMHLRPATVEHLVRGVKSERPTARPGLGRVVLIQPHAHRPSARRRHTRLQREDAADMLHP